MSDAQLSEVEWTCTEILMDHAQRPLLAKLLALPAGRWFRLSPHLEGPLKGRAELMRDVFAAWLHAPEIELFGEVVVVLMFDARTALNFAGYLDVKSLDLDEAETNH